MEEDDVEALAERAGNALADGELQTAAQLLHEKLPVICRLIRSLRA